MKKPKTVKQCDIRLKSLKKQSKEVEGLKKKLAKAVKKKAVKKKPAKKKKR